MKEENCYKQIRVSNFWSTNYIEYNTFQLQNIVIKLDHI